MGCSSSKPAAAPPATAKKAAPRDVASSTNGTIENMLIEQTGAAARRLKNIFALPLDMLSEEGYKPLVIDKTDAEEMFILKALKQSFVFEGLSTKELLPLIKAFDKFDVAKDEVIIQQGDEGDFFYILNSGKVEFIVSDNKVGDTDTRGASFGELALLYKCPRAATVRAMVPSTLFRVDQKAFRYILQNQMKEKEASKKQLLMNVPFFKDLRDQDLSKLIDVMTPQEFKKGEVLMEKGERGTFLLLIEEGTLVAKDIGTGSSTYEDVKIRKGGHVGERALVTGEPRVATVKAATDGLAFRIEKDVFDSVVGSVEKLVYMALEKTRLNAIKVISDAQLPGIILDSFVNSMETKTFPAGTVVFPEGIKIEPAVYIVRKGAAEVASKDGKANRAVDKTGFFGEDLLRADHAAGDYVADVTTKYTVTVTEDMECGVLKLAACRQMVDTTQFGESGKIGRPDSIRFQHVKLDDFKRHRIIGAGTFGQVWLVSRENSDGEKKAYALKVQSKYELVQDGQAKAVVGEKNIMAELKHHFLASLEAAFQDDQFVFMLMDLVQGGELYAVINRNKRKPGMKESDAKFLAAGIQEGLAFMHRRGYVYRDLKAENVLISNQGFPVIVDYGFIKFITDKTYTFCGTPLYLSPEIIMNRGHNWGTDHWSMGCLIHEMITGETPFMNQFITDQMQLLKSICQSKYDPPRGVSKEMKDFLTAILVKNPTQRLGSLADGENDIFEHSWFSDIDFRQLRKLELKSPFVPKISDPFDASNFSDWSQVEDKLTKKYPGLEPKHEKIFEKF